MGLEKEHGNCIVWRIAYVGRSIGLRANDGVEPADHYKIYKDMYMSKDVGYKLTANAAATDVLVHNTDWGHHWKVEEWVQYE